MGTLSLATKGRHPAQVVDINVRPTRKGDKQIACIRFKLLDEKAAATLWILLGENTEQLLAGIPGYQGKTIDPIQILGRSADIDVTHGQGADASSVYANVVPETIVWETELAQMVEKPDDPRCRTILIAATHPKSGTYANGLYFFRVIAEAKVFSREVPNCKCAFDAAKQGILDLLASAQQKNVTLRLLTDQKPLVTADDVLRRIGSSSIQWMPGVDLKRRLFRRLQKPDPAKRKPATSAPEPPAHADWIEALG